MNDLDAGVSGCPFDLKFKDERGKCDRCGVQLGKYKRRWCGDECALAWFRNHSWSFARPAALRRDGYTCTRCGVKPGCPEVDHIVPCIGRHHVKGCHNHLDNLRTLCPPCHLEVTKEQRAAGHFRKPINVAAALHEALNG